MANGPTLPVEFNERKSIQQPLFPEQAESSPGCAEVVLIGFPVTEEFRQIADTKAEIFGQEIKGSSFYRREVERSVTLRR